MFEAVGAFAEGRIDDAELLAIEQAACPGVGSCAGMFTANTMAQRRRGIGDVAAGERLGPGGRRPRLERYAVDPARR